MARQLPPCAPPTEAPCPRHPPPAAAASRRCRPPRLGRRPAASQPSAARPALCPLAPSCPASGAVDPRGTGLAARLRCPPAQPPAAGTPASVAAAAPQLAGPAQPMALHLAAAADPDPAHLEEGRAGHAEAGLLGSAPCCCRLPPPRPRCSQPAAGLPAPQQRRRRLPATAAGPPL